MTIQGKFKTILLDSGTNIFPKNILTTKKATYLAAALVALVR